MGREVAMSLRSSPLPGATSSSTASSSQGRGGTTNSGTMRLPSGVCVPSPTPNVRQPPLSLRQDHSEDRAGTGQLQLHAGDEPQRQVLRHQVPQFRLQGLEPPLLAAIQQVQYVPLHAGTDAPGAGNYFPVNDLSDSGKYVLSTQKGSGKRRLDQ